MTIATHAPFRPGIFAAGASADQGFFASLRAALERYLDYRRTLAQLRTLSIRQRDDVGIAGLDLKSVARAAAEAR